jgi:hypothetical protein
MKTMFKIHESLQIQQQQPIKTKKISIDGGGSDDDIDDIEALTGSDDDDDDEEDADVEEVPVVQQETTSLMRKKAMSRFIAARKRYSKPIPCEPRTDIEPQQVLMSSRKAQNVTAMDETTL